jgi:hypothetical protein
VEWKKQGKGDIEIIVRTEVKTLALLTDGERVSTEHRRRGGGGEGWAEQGVVWRKEGREAGIRCFPFVFSFEEEEENKT